jgi:hypothetical protein
MSQRDVSRPCGRSSPDERLLELRHSRLEFALFVIRHGLSEHDERRPPCAKQMSA